MDGWIAGLVDGRTNLWTNEGICLIFFMKRLSCHLNVSKFHNNTPLESLNYGSLYVTLCFVLRRFDFGVLTFDFRILSFLF